LRSFADATTDYALLLQTIAEKVSWLVGHAVTVRLLCDEGTALETVARHDPQDSPVFQALGSRKIPVAGKIKEALEHQQAYVDELAPTVQDAHPNSRTDVALKAILVAPLVARNEPLGFLFVIQRDDGSRAFTTDDIDLVDGLARHAALALSNSRLVSSLAINERARAHERSILDTVLAPLMLLDKQGGLLDANRSFYSSFGVDAKTSSGMNVFALGEGVFDVPAFRERFATLPTPFTELELTIGVRTWRVRTKTTFRPGNGSETSLVTFLDVTDRIAAERLARRQALLIASMSEALIGMRADFVIEQWNPAAERLFGWMASEVIGRVVTEVLVTVEGDREGRRKKLLAGERTADMVRMKNRAGDWVDVEFSTMPINDGETITGFVAVMLDVSARERLDAELRRRIDELTAANHELESFSYSVSHDLRAPVRAIDGFSEILEQEHSKSLDDEGRRVLATVRKNAKRMGILIDDLLALARFSRQPLEETQVDMNELARTSLEEARRAEPDRTIATTFPAALPPVRGDEGLLRQVWLNLYSNSVKYSRGKPDAAIETTAAESNGEVVFTVRDNGAGFDMRYADKLFGTFERLHSAKEFEGTGIGLALVARIVKRHGGRVWGEGTTGKGATFHVALPKAKQGT
jgi:PAS domain S-box-containing protein